MKKISKTPVALAVASAFGASVTAQAAIIPVRLVLVYQEVNDGSSQGYLTGDTATWKFNTVTGRVFQKSGTHQTNYFVAGITPVFDHIITGFEIGGGLDAAATSYSCAEGTFGEAVHASICGNYNFGPDFGKTNESSTTWGPGTAFARTMGGDDIALGPQQNLSQFDGMTTSWSGGTVITLSNTMPGANGYVMEFSTIPVPPAVWLFGSALAVLGWLRRRTN